MSLPRQVALVAALLLHAAAARAEPSPVGACQPSQGTLAFVACSLAERLGPAANGASVTVIELKSDRELPLASALRERVQGAVATALHVSPTAPKAHDRAKLRVELSIDASAGGLRVTADLRRASGLWRRILHSEPRAQQHAFVEAAFDAELRALIPPPPLIVRRAVKVKAPERGIVALACGPLRGDGGQELALVSRGHVRVGHVSGRVFVERKRAAWSALSAVAGSPLREPIATAEITPEGTLRVGLTDRMDGLELSRELAIVRRFAALLPVPNGGCAARSELGLSWQLGSCAVGERAALSAPHASVDAIVGSPRGAIGREQTSARLIGAPPEVQQLTTRVGAQLALGDADSDGNLELAYSSDSFDALKDRLTVVTLEGNKLTRRFELPAPAISAIAICSRREGPGMAPIVLAAGDELWLLQ